MIAVDTPGYGESDRPPARPSLASYGDAVLIALIPRFGRRFDWLGYHTGAVIAADLAARRSETRRAVLAAFPLLEQSRRQILLAQFAAPEASYANDGSHLPLLRTCTFGVRPPEQSLDDVARLVAEMQRPGRYREWALHSALEADLEAILGAIGRANPVRRALHFRPSTGPRAVRRCACANRTACARVRRRAVNPRSAPDLTPGWRDEKLSGQFLEIPHHGRRRPSALHRTHPASDVA